MTNAAVSECQCSSYQILAKAKIGFQRLVRLLHGEVEGEGQLINNALTTRRVLAKVSWYGKIHQKEITIFWSQNLDRHPSCLVPPTSSTALDSDVRLFGCQYYTFHN